MTHLRLYETPNLGVLQTGSSSVRVLLPLTLPLPAIEAQNGSGPAMDQLVRALSADTDKALIDAMINASEAGEQAVTDTIALAINGPFLSKPEEEQS